MKNGGNNQQWRNQGNGTTNGQGNNQLQSQQQQINLQGLLSALQNFALNQPPPPPPKYEPPFGGFMAKVKFRSMVAQVADEKTSDAYIDSGATHHFFHSRSVFINYSPVTEEPVKAAAGVAKIAGKGLVRLPVNNGMLVEAYHAPKFSSNILSVRLLQKNFEVLFSESIRGYPACYFLRKGTFNYAPRVQAPRRTVPLEMPVEEGHGKGGIQAYIARRPRNGELVAEWHRKLGHIHADRYYKLSEQCEDVPKFDRVVSATTNVSLALLRSSSSSFIALNQESYTYS